MPYVQSCVRFSVGLMPWVALSSLAVGGCVSPEPGVSTSEAFQAKHRVMSVAESARGPQSPASQPPILDGSSSLADYLQYAALSNPGLEAAFYRWKAALERVPQVTAPPDPRFTYRYFIREVETRVGPQQQGVGLAQTFPWLGKLKLRGDMAAEAARAARRNYESAKLALFHEVKDAYYEYYYLGRSIDVVQENLDLVKYLESVARVRYKTAATGHPDVIRAQVELGRLRDRLDALRDWRVPVVARLNAALNRPSYSALPLPAAIPSERMTVSDEQVLRWLAQANPELKARDHAVEEARYAIDLARKDYYPDITLGIDYTDVGSPPRMKGQGLANSGAMRSISRLGGGMGDPIDLYSIGRSFRPADRPGDAGKDVWMVSLSMNVPIWRGKYAAGEREARARHLAAKSKRAERENALVAIGQRVLYEYRDAERKIGLYRNTLVPEARQSLHSTEAAFRAGASGFLDLIDAERTLLDFELSYERALSNRAQRLAELEKLVGRSIPTESAASIEHHRQGSDG